MREHSRRFNRRDRESLKDFFVHSIVRFAAGVVIITAAILILAVGVLLGIAMTALVLMSEATSTVIIDAEEYALGEASSIYESASSLMLNVAPNIVPMVAVVVGILLVFSITVMMIYKLVILPDMQNLLIALLENIKGMPVESEDSQVRTSGDNSQPSAPDQPNHHSNYNPPVNPAPYTPNVAVTDEFLSTVNTALQEPNKHGSHILDSNTRKSLNMINLKSCANYGTGRYTVHDAQFEESSNFSFFGKANGDHVKVIPSHISYSYNDFVAAGGNLVFDVSELRNFPAANIKITEVIEPAILRRKLGLNSDYYVIESQGKISI